MQGTEPANWEQTLIKYGIEVGLLVSGFFGALMMVSKRSAQRISTTIASVLAGTACANYLTPVVLHFAPATIQEGRGKYAAAFVMGFLGLKGLEMVVDRWFEKDGYTPQNTRKPPKPRKPSKPRKPRKPKSKTSIKPKSRRK